MLMDGKNYKESVALHRQEVQVDLLRDKFKAYQNRDITFLRDGGDALGVSKKAKEFAIEYEIDYRTPIFAIHKKGHYGGIVGRSYEDLKDFHNLVKEARREGADFIKIMISGIMNFEEVGSLSESGLEREEIKSLIEIAHGEGAAVMVHGNGNQTVQTAIEAGADSIEHGNYLELETLKIMSERETIWIPTLITIGNSKIKERFSKQVLDKIQRKQEENIRFAIKNNVFLGLGSDAGAYGVEHGSGTIEEGKLLLEILDDTEKVRELILKTEEKVKEKFIWN